MAKQSKPMNRAQIRKAIDDELIKLEQERENGRLKNASWKIRRIRAEADSLAAWAEESSRQEGAPEVDEAAISQGIRVVLQRINEQQAQGYRNAVERALAKLREKTRRECCTKYELVNWPFCIAGC